MPRVAARLPLCGLLCRTWRRGLSGGLRVVPSDAAGSQSRGGLPRFHSPSLLPSKVAESLTLFSRYVAVFSCRHFVELLVLPYCYFDGGLFFRRVLTGKCCADPRRRVLAHVEGAAPRTK